MIIIVDSDGFIGNLDPDDVHHSNIQQILVGLLKKDAQLIYPVTTIVETVTFLQGRLNAPKLASNVLQMVNDNQLFFDKFYKRKGFKLASEL